MQTVKVLKSASLESEYSILSLVIHCYQESDGFILRLTSIFSLYFTQWSLRFER